MNTQEMFLESASGFMMPFAATGEDDVQVTLGFGEQRHPRTGDMFTHRGIDFACKDKPLFALASGTVVGVGTDAIHQNYIVVKYGKYEAKYGHLSEAYVHYGQSVTAGEQVAKSGDFLHFEVTFAGELLDPAEFLGMIYGNMMQLEALGVKGHYRLANIDVPVHTDYDKDQDEITRLMLRFLPEYMNALRVGSYAPSQRFEQSLRNVFAQSSDKGYFFDAVPDYGNPLGLTARSAPLVSKVQNLLIGDFLNYLALQRGVYLSSWDEGQKKNFLTRHQPMV